MKHFAALLHLEDQEKNVSLRPQHLAFLAAQEALGRVFARGPFSDGSGGLVIYLAESFEQALALAQCDPYVAQGARRLELHEWSATMSGATALVPRA